jgi:hypothetical protein
MAPRTPALKRVVEQIQRKIRQQWDTDAEFHRQSGCEVAYFSVRRTLDPQGPAPSVDTLVAVALAAGFRPAEIREFLVQIGDRTIHRLIPAGTRELSDRELALVDAVAKLQDDGRTWERMADHLHLLANAAQVDISAEIKRMGR